MSAGGSKDPPVFSAVVSGIQGSYPTSEAVAEFCGGLHFAAFRQNAQRAAAHAPYRGGSLTPEKAYAIHCLCALIPGKAAKHSRIRSGELNDLFGAVIGRKLVHEVRKTKLT
jgi:hypothetical protein